MDFEFTGSGTSSISDKQKAPPKKTLLQDKNPYN